MIYEQALDNVGMLLDSGSLWKSCVDFINNWPDASGMDPVKKIQTLRKYYQHFMNKKSLTITAFILFSLFFGADNLILPPQLGFNSGN